MKITKKLLIILMIAGSAGAQTWPSGALPDPDAGLPCPPTGQLSLRLAGATLSNDVWSDQRTKLSISMGLGRGLGITASGSTRDLSGRGAFQRGVEDARLGLACWKRLFPNFSGGLNGNFVVPTGYRKQQTYYDAAADSMRMLPAFSLDQTAGEIYAGAVWSLGPATEVNSFAGYFSTADRFEQAFRWGLGAAIAPFGRLATAEFGYAQSLTRTGSFPNTQAMSAAVAVRVGYGFSLAPGVWADLSDEPMWGAAVGLRFMAPVAHVTVTERGELKAAEILPRVGGSVLVPPPLTALDLADRGELWQSIQQELGNTFDAVQALPSLDVPGLPFSDQTLESLQQSVRALAKAHPEADWLLISRVERENVGRASGLKIPLVVEQPLWTAKCRLQVRLVNLRDGHVRYQDVVDATASRRANAMKTAISDPGREILGQSASRELTFEAYREAGRVIARELSYAP